MLLCLKFLIGWDNVRLKILGAEIKKKLEVFGPFTIWLVCGLVIGFLSLLLFIDLSEDVYFNEIKAFDDFVTEIVRHSINNNTTDIMKIISNMASTATISIMCVLLIIYFSHMKKHITASLVPTVVVGSILLNLVLKNIFERQRPSIPHLVEAFGLSFPSGHSMVSFSFYGLIIYLVFKEVKNKLLKTLSIIIFGLLILLIGISRIYLGVHYPSDVLAGFAAGSFWLVCCIYGFRIIENKYSR